MVSSRWSFLSVIFALALVPACDSADELSDELVDEEEVDDGGRDPAPREGQVNGFNLNGFNLNGFNLNGFNLNTDVILGGVDADEYIQTLGFDLKGMDTAASSWLVGSELFVETNEGEVLSGAELKGVEVIFDLAEDGKGKHSKRVKITSVTPSGENPDVLFYGVDLKYGVGAWSSLCTDSEGNATEAILIGNLWDPASGARAADGVEGSVTFACRGAALAKCVEWGYRPWGEAGGVSLRDFHQTCTRLVRADYCGDGISHTVDGTGVHVLDELGVQNLDPQVSFVIEAEWGPNGAVCLNAANTRLADVQIECEVPVCGAPFESGGLIQSGKIIAP